MTGHNHHLGSKRELLLIKRRFQIYLYYNILFYEDNTAFRSDTSLGIAFWTGWRRSSAVQQMTGCWKTTCLRRKRSLPPLFPWSEAILAAISAGETTPAHPGGSECLPYVGVSGSELGFTRFTSDELGLGLYSGGFSTG